MFTFCGLFDNIFVTFSPKIPPLISPFEATEPLLIPPFRDSAPTPMIVACGYIFLYFFFSISLALFHWSCWVFASVMFDMRHIVSLPFSYSLKLILLCCSTNSVTFSIPLVCQHTDACCSMENELTTLFSNIVFGGYSGTYRQTTHTAININQAVFKMSWWSPLVVCNAPYRGLGRALQLHSPEERLLSLLSVHSKRWQSNVF